MNKLFRPKCLRRVLLCLALLFPIVYLCGGLFFALAGAHGENVLATEETSIVNRKNLDFNQRIRNGNFTSTTSWNSSGSANFIVNSNIANLSFTSTSSGYLYPNYQIETIPNDIYYVRVYVRNNDSTTTYRLSTVYSGNEPFSSSDSWTLLELRASRTSAISSYYPRIYIESPTLDTIVYVKEFQLFNLTQMYGKGNEPSIQEFKADFPLDYYDYTLSEFVSIPVYGIPSEQNSLFYHIFGQRNFISQLGKDLIDGTTKGFNPMNELFRSINTNIMHFEDTDGLAMFGLGYVYYAVNVLIVYEILILAVKLIMLPLSAVDLFDKKEDI